MKEISPSHMHFHLIFLIYPTKEGPVPKQVGLVSALRFLGEFFKGFLDGVRVAEGNTTPCYFLNDIV